MKNSCKLCWTVSALSVVLVAAMAWMFLIKGNVTDSDDGRTAIILTTGERDIVLAEMRGFLESIQGITEGLAKKDLASIGENARQAGMANVKGVPTSLMGKLPMAFKSLGMDTHKAFDALAAESRDMEDPQIILEKLGELMLNCTSCHSGYRIDIEKSSQ